MSQSIIYKGKSTDSEKNYQNVTFFEENKAIQIKKTIPINRYEQIIEIEVNPTLQFGA